MRKRPTKKKDLPEALAVVIQLLCATPQEAEQTFLLGHQEAVDVLEKRPVMVTPDQLSLITSICKNQLKYALPMRLKQLLYNSQTRPLLLLWVNTAAHMLDRFRSLKRTRDQSIFINRFEPVMGSLYDMAVSMDEVEKLLLQIHDIMPQFDELFFHGTRFRDSFQGIPDKVIHGPEVSSYDVASLSPGDLAAYQKMKQEIQ